MEDKLEGLPNQSTARHAVWDALQSHMPVEWSDASSSKEEVKEDSSGSNNTDNSDLDTDINSDVDDFEGDAFTWEKLVEEIKHAGWAVDNLLPLMMAALRAYALEILENLLTKTFAKLPNTFLGDCRMLWKRMHTVVKGVSGFKPEKYNMCEDLCVLFARLYTRLRKGPKLKCSQGRYNRSRCPIKQFTYLPLIPCLKAFLAHLETAQKLLYRAQEHIHQPDMITDIFNSKVYQQLCGKHVVVNSKRMKYVYFGNNCDMAPGLSTDRLAPFKHQKLTAWLLLVVNFNLPPKLRFLKDFMLCLGVVKKPFYFNSFLWPFVQEALKLESGVAVWDAVKCKAFMLCAFFHAVFEDMPAMAMIMCMMVSIFATSAIFVACTCLARRALLTMCLSTIHSILLFAQIHCLRSTMNQTISQCVHMQSPCSRPRMSSRHLLLLGLGAVLRHAESRVCQFSCISALSPSRIHSCMTSCT
jgi:hypothetical protein